MKSVFQFFSSILLAVIFCRNFCETNRGLWFWHRWKISDSNNDIRNAKNQHPSISCQNLISSDQGPFFKERKSVYMSTICKPVSIALVKKPYVLHPWLVWKIWFNMNQPNLHHFCPLLCQCGWKSARTKIGKYF